MRRPSSNRGRVALSILVVGLGSGSGVAINGSAASGEQAGAPSEIVIGQLVELESVLLGETRTLRIGAPEFYDASTDPACVLYVLDGETLFTQAVGAVRHLSEFEAPPIIVVGIDNTERTRDLTPPAEDEATRVDFPSGGGSEAFRRYLLEEVKPFVEQRYRTNGIDILAGHSFGGLFTAETLLLEPKAFDSFLSLSPSLWWDDAALVDAFRELETDHPLFERFVWFAMGDEGAGMNPHFEAVTWTLRDKAPTSFRWGKRHFEGHDHWSAALPSLSEGLRSYFEPIRTYGARAVSFDDFEREFDTIRQEFGGAIRMTAGPIVRRARELKDQQNHLAAQTILEGAIGRIPDEPLLHYILGEILIASGHPGQAQAALESAISTFTNQPEHATAVEWLQRQLATAKLSLNPR